MTNIQKAIDTLSNDLGAFAEIGDELRDLRKNVTSRPVVGATRYRRCLEDLNNQLKHLDDQIGTVKDALYASPSLQVRGKSLSLFGINMSCANSKSPTPIFLLDFGSLLSSCL